MEPRYVKVKKVVHSCLLFGENMCKRGHIFKCQMNQLSSLYRKDEFGQRLITFGELAERPAEADPEGFMA